MQTTQNSAALFSGEFRHALDGKNRVTIPSRWRLTEADEFHLVPDSQQNCLRVMPPDEFRAVSDQAAQLPGMTPKEHRVFMRQFYSRSQHVVADKQGRILVPDEYCRRFKLEGEIVLVGVRETFELWNAEAWQKTQTNEEPTYDRWADQLGI
ncbi:MAG TPA: hypothetical protein VF614_07745 [Chthoniobacteraceae bacterium]|jgi:MraZ protein